MEAGGAKHVHMARTSRAVEISLARCVRPTLPRGLGAYRETLACATMALQATARTAKRVCLELTNRYPERTHVCSLFENSP